jgi:hypothetical protein
MTDKEWLGGQSISTFSGVRYGCVQNIGWDGWRKSGKLPNWNIANLWCFGVSIQTYL